MNEEELIKYVRENKEELKKKYNVEDVSVGRKKVNGIITTTPCIRLWPKIKGKFDKQNIIPNQIEGIPTDVETEPIFDALSYTYEYRPLKLGCSIGNITITAGTLGFVYEKEGRKFWLSNAHVFSENPFKYISEQETRIVQPGKYHGGSEVVGNLRYMILLNDINGEPMKESKHYDDGTFTQLGVMNSADCALAEVKENNWDLVTTNNISGWKGPHIAEGVAVLGDKITYTSWQSNGTTEGTVTDLGKAVIVNYGDGKQAKIIDCVLTTKMSGPGSSGSGAMIDRDGTLIACGLNFAGSEMYNVICGIQHINNAFGGKVLTVEQTPTEYNFIVSLEESEEPGLYKIKGLVKDSKTGVGIEGASVILEKDDIVVNKNTDAIGVVEVEDLYEGNYKLTVSKEGYKAYEGVLIVP